MQITVNGKVVTVDASSTIATMLEALDLPTTRVAVEHNRAVVRRADWATTALAAGDVVEVVHFVGGG